jgi:hypothetical protein
VAARLTVIADSSAWIAYLRTEKTDASIKLDMAILRETVLVADLILAEVLRGLPNERVAASIGASLDAFPIVEIGGRETAKEAARMYRHMRGKGVTVRGTLDLMVGAWCCMNSVPLIHDDSDFAAMERWCGLQRWRPPLN